MDLVYSIQDYVTRMTESVGGMKALLMDKETTAIVSMVYSRSKVLEKEIFLFQRLDAERRGEMLHLKAVVFLRPNRENIALLAKELHEPKFGEYHLFFSNVISNEAVQMLAQADEFELVKQLQEYYADFYALSPICCSLGLPSNSALTMSLSERTRDGLFAVLLAMKKKPAIRYQQSSKDAERIAALLSQHIDQHQEILDFNSGKGCDTPPLLLILDRFDDPVTPLLNQWTYQAMIHELIGIRNNIVELPGDPGAKGKAGIDSQQIVFSTETDDFYRENLYTDYGQLHDRLMHALDAFKKANPTLQAVEDTRGGAPVFQTIADMQKFVEKYPEMHKLKDCVAKHVNVLHALSRIIEQDNVMEASELEQQLACVQDHKAALKQVTTMVTGSTITDFQKLRLILLFVLRYQKEALEKGELASLLHHLPSTLRPDSLQLPDSHTIPQTLLQVCGREARTPGSDLFNRGVTAVVMNGLSGLKGLSMRGQGAEQDNAFMLHEPLLARLLRDLERVKLSEEAYPYKPCSAHKGLALIETLRAMKRGPTEVIVFIVGGATYAEARVAARWNEANKHLRVILGGTCFLSSAAFVQSVIARAAEQPPMSENSTAHNTAPRDKHSAAAGVIVH